MACNNDKEKSRVKAERLAIHLKNDTVIYYDPNCGFRECSLTFAQLNKYEIIEQIKYISVDAADSNL